MARLVAKRGRDRPVRHCQLFRPVAASARRGAHAWPCWPSRSPSLAALCRRAAGVPRARRGRRPPPARTRRAAWSIGRSRTLEDRIPGGADDRAAEALWQAHRARMRAALRSVRVGWPQPGLPGRDPWALRAALLLVLRRRRRRSPAADGGDRLLRAVTPGLGRGGRSPPACFDLWITPPAYTGLAPLLPAPSPARAAEIAVPTGSVLLAQVSGGTGMPKLTIDGKATAFSGGRQRGLTACPDDDCRRLAADRRAGRQAARQLGDEIIPDARAENRIRHGAVAHAAAPRSSSNTTPATITAWHRSNAVISRAERPEGVPDEQIDIALPLPGQRLKEAKGVELPRPDRASVGGAAGQDHAQGRRTPPARQAPPRSSRRCCPSACSSTRSRAPSSSSAATWSPIPTSARSSPRARRDRLHAGRTYHDDVVVYLALKTASARGGARRDPGRARRGAAPAVGYGAAHRGRPAVDRRARSARDCSSGCRTRSPTTRPTPRSRS